MLFLRDLIFPGLLFLIPAAPAAAELSCGGIAKQSGLLVCSGPAETEIDVSTAGGENVRTVKTDADGQVVIGLAQDEAPDLVLTPKSPGAAPLNMSIAPRNDDYRVIRGLDCDKVDARTEEQKQHAADSWVKKQAAFETFNRGPAASQGFVKPASGPTSSPFGPTRKYIGVGADGKECESTSVHRGYDMAIPTGTPIVAPASGVVILGDPDLYYEGGAVFLDHGGGLVSVFMHMSKVEVKAGDFVGTGNQLGLSGNTGRTTGPHLHWAVKWRNTASDDRDGDFYIDPALLLELQPDSAASAEEMPN
ncbi:M23 family metallopeptidase [Henriciella sp. AS95]|uniref:M23 family metallopeptidase n=1 Tax=Henriciella sp. AS95 TaxID=3135782 RepID=UPI003172F17E